MGLDVGTSTTQLILSQLQVGNRSSGFTVPEMVITHREVVYRSPVHFTPLKNHSLVDGEKLQKLVLQEYENAGITRQQVDTGAIIITGETSRKENAGEVLQALSGFAGDFVVATAGPDLESVLAAKGAGATDFSRKTGKTVLHMDIGGGTSNLALIRDGEIVQTGCLNVGGRLLKLDPQGKITYVSPVLEKLWNFRVGETPDTQVLSQVADTLCHALEMAAGRKEATELLHRLATDEVQGSWMPPTETVTVSFSGGVADCIENTFAPLEFGDIGPLLGQAIRNSSLCHGDYILGQETIRATVIGAGCHSTQLSGSTVYCRGISLPKKNLPVVSFTGQEQESRDFPQIIARKLQSVDAPEAVLAIPGYDSPSHQALARLAEEILRGVGQKAVYLCMEGDMAKALGQKISLLRPETPCLCLDKLKFTPQSYLDIGAPVGPCFPVVIKTLVLSKET